jgi:hypothetical protein
VGLALLGLTQAVELQAHAFNAQLFPQERPAKSLRHPARAGKAHGFHTDLVELAIAAALRALVAKHLADVEQALAAFVEQIVSRPPNAPRRPCLQGAGSAARR